jgi:hypothetical protein
MGSHHSYYLDANTYNPIDILKIKEHLKTCSSPNDCSDLWRNWSEESKWNEGCEVASALSIKFSHLIFSICDNGDYGYFKMFYKSGKWVMEESVVSKFPTTAKFDKAWKEKIHNDKLKKAKEAKDKAIQEEKEKLERIASLESELEKLKTG